MDIEKIALEVWGESSKATNHTFSHEITVTHFAKALVARLSEDAKPVAWCSLTEPWVMYPLKDDQNNGYVPLYLHPPLTQQIPDGWKLVLIEPTEEMLATIKSPGELLARSKDFEHYNIRANQRYKAMLAAAPEYKEESK